MRALVAVALASALLAPALSCSGGRGGERPRMIVLGMDGLDYRLVRQLMDAGRLPNFRRLAERGAFQPLQTAVSPQSPVAWSNFITGLDSGGHGIFDFLHRDLSSTRLPFGLPYTSTSLPQPPGRILRFEGWIPHWQDGPPGRSVQIGRWILPLSGGELRLGRFGRAFWEVLEEHGVRATIVRMPANFPPIGKAHAELSGMGTPDLRGTPGEFTFYSTDRHQFLKRGVTGGDIYPADVRDGVFHGVLYGPPDNPFTAEEDDAPEAPFTVYIDADNAVALFELGDRRFVLRAGEWSDWQPVSFELIPWVTSIQGAVRFYLKSLRPHFELYVTPVQIDPLEPAMPISAPASFAAELAEATGRFYTQEMPEDTKAIIHGVFDIDDFLAQTSIAREETIRQYRRLLQSWDGDFLFYYFGSSDQVSHVLWGWTRDPEHPAYVPERHDRYRDVIPRLYEQLDAVVGETLDRIDEHTMLVVMSDHGFTSWRRSFDLNAWLVDHGYMRLDKGAERPVEEFFRGVAWHRTRAYALGIAGIYLNLQGREPEGIVPPAEREGLMRRIERDLLAAIDPKTGEPAVTRVFLRERDFHDRGHLEIGPDIVVGFAEHVRGSGKAALGGIGTEFISDNVDDWSGDHIMDPSTVPGVLFSSRPLRRSATSLQDLAAALLAEFGIEGFPDGSEPVTVGDER